jgi:hypothetical protein
MSGHACSHAGGEELFLTPTEHLQSVPPAHVPLFVQPVGSVLLAGVPPAAHVPVVQPRGGRRRDRLLRYGHQGQAEQSATQSQRDFRQPIVQVHYPKPP